MLFVFTFTLPKQNYTILYTFSILYTFNFQDTHFQLPHKKVLIKILGIEVSLNQVTDKRRKNVKLSEYFTKYD